MTEPAPVGSAAGGEPDGDREPGSVEAAEPLQQGAPPLVWKRTWVDDRPALYGVTGEGMPALFLHGWGLGHHAYRDAIARLANMGTRVFAPAQPGFGGTADLPEREFSLGGYARWLDRFCETVKIGEPALVVGHSFGGGVAIRFAHDFGERVRSLVLLNSIGGSAWNRGSIVRTLAERPLWDWGLHFPTDIWPVGQATRVLPVLLQDALPNLVRNPRAFWKVGQIARRVDLTGELEELKDRGLPVAVVWGNRDGVIPRESFESVCRALEVEGTVVEGSHSWMLADPDAFGEVITNAVSVARAAREAEAREDAAAPPRRRRGRKRARTLRSLSSARAPERSQGADQTG